VMNLFDDYSALDNVRVALPETRARGLSMLGAFGGETDVLSRVGLAGALFAMAQQSAYPNVMSLHSSGFVVMMVLIGGGLVSFWGPLIGAVFFILARDVLGAVTTAWMLWFGLLFMAIVLFKPEGVAGMFHVRSKSAA